MLFSKKIRIKLKTVSVTNTKCDINFIYFFVKSKRNLKKFSRCKDNRVVKTEKNPSEKK